MMLNMDPPQHDRFKLLVSRGFTPKNAQLLADRIAELSSDIVDEVADRGECDFVTDVAGRLPSALIAELMGILVPTASACTSSPRSCTPPTTPWHRPRRRAPRSWRC
ncbi:MAG: hypothetical protein R2713_02705 [Ilumatobacteraceae bacterium]